jgi:uncharacterized membrane protein
MTPDERWETAKQLRKVTNGIYIFNLVILVCIFLVKCSSSKNIEQTNTGETLNTNASIRATNGANVRQSPTISATIVDKLSNKERVFIIDTSSNSDNVNGQNGYWYRVRTKDGRVGYVWSGAVRPDE